MTVIALPIAIDALNYLGTVAFAVTDALRAMSKCLDLMGAVAIGSSERFGWVVA
ncbi:MAG: hypothetical protein Q9M14_00570 [Mariprofundaceae bacterium]|nr:hypothetical protein [Mariprofundaceae bacterium]